MHLAGPMEPEHVAIHSHSRGPMVLYFQEMT